VKLGERPSREPGRASSPFRLKGFRFLFASNAASVWGAAISSVTITWFVYHVTHSAVDVAYVGIVSFVPGLAFGLVAGVIADRYNRRTLMVLADGVRAVALAILTVFLYLAGFDLVTILVVLVLIYACTAVFGPASQAILPQLVRVHQFEDANGALEAAGAVSTTLGAAAGGLIVVSLGPVAGIGLNAITYALSALLLLQIAAGAGRIPVVERVGGPSFQSDLVTGFRYLWRNTPVLQVTLGVLPAGFFFWMVSGFLVVYASSIPWSSSALYGFLIASTGLGGALGAICVGRIHARRFAGIAVGAAVLGLSGAVAVLVLDRSVEFAIAGCFFLGFGISLINTTYYATVQAVVPNEVLARVLSIDSVGGLLAAPLGLLSGGLLVASEGVMAAYLWAGVGLLVNGIILLGLRGSRSFGYQG